MTGPDLSGMTARELMQTEAAINTELRARGLVRTSNKPLGDVAESIVHRARGGQLEPNSTRSHDITAPDGTTIQVKAMGLRTAGNNAKFSPFRSLSFTTAVFLLFDASYDLTEAWEVPAALIAETPHVAHINGRMASLRWVRDHGADVTAEMASAWDAINASLTRG